MGNILTNFDQNALFVNSHFFKSHQNQCKDFETWLKLI